MFFPSKYLIAAVLIHGCVGFFEDFIQLLFTKCPVPLMHFYNLSLTQHYGMIMKDGGNSQILSIISNCQEFGTILSLIFILPRMDSFGRKKVAIYFRSGVGFLMVTFMLAGKIFTSIELFAIGTLLLGATRPIKAGVTRLYLSECSPDSIRGFITQGVTTVGTVAVTGFSAVFLPQLLGNDERWHFALYIALANVLIFTVGAMFIPESPKFLWFSNNKTEAIKAIEAFHGKKINTSQILISYELERSIGHSNTTHMSIKKIWADPGLRDSLILVLVAATVAVIGPMQIYFVYAIVLKIRYGFTNSQAITFDLFSSIITLPLSCLLPYLYERIGRRPIFLFTCSLSIFAAFLILIGECVFEFNGSIPTWVTLVCAGLFSIVLDLAITLGFLTFAVLIIADLLPASAKAATTQAMMLLSSLSALGFNFVYSFLEPLLGFGIYIPIIVIQLAFTLYIYRNLPETKQKAIYQNYEQVRSRRTSTLTPLIRSRIGTNKYNAV